MHRLLLLLLTVLNIKSGNNDVPPTAIMQLSGHKNVQSINRYSTVSQKQQLNMSHTLTGMSSREITPQSGSSIPEKRKHEFDELTYPTFCPFFLSKASKQHSSPFLFFSGAVLSGGHIGAAINTLNCPHFQCERKTLAKLTKESNLLVRILTGVCQFKHAGPHKQQKMKSRVFRHIFRMSYFILTSSAF